MPKAPKQKQKLLYLARYFMERTDENHQVNTPQLIAYLEANDIKAERKSIYDDIETLREFGMDIVKSPGPKGGYFLASREFELAEVKLLVDLVQSAKFLTTKKSRELTGKLEREVSKNDAIALHRQVVVSERSKAVNENIYYSVDVIYEAIAKNTRVRYQYFEWNVKKEMQLRRDGAYYEVSPWLLTWDNENYYLVAYDEDAEKMKYFRVDKMLHIERTDKPRLGKEAFEDLDVAAFSKRTFGMFAGEERTVQLRIDNSLINVIVDRFGANAALRPLDEEHALARVKAEVSPQFFGWLAGLSDRVKIHGPQDVAEAYKDYLSKILKNYEEGTDAT
jgi:predicted DNA-binding transcriptional regulator YafY